MSKLIELSIIIALIAIPARAARQKNPRLGLRKMIINMLIFEVFYVFSMRFLHGRF
jgi:hypothetical protein